MAAALDENILSLLPHPTFAHLVTVQASLVVQTVKNPPAVWETGFNPWVGKIPWRREWQPTPVFLSGESNGQRSLAGYSLQGYKELDMTEAT